MRPPSINKLLIANRGEIAIRIARSARDLGIRTVAVYSDPDKDAEHVHAADEAVLIGPAQASESYLNIGAIIEALVRCGCDAVHPGYGFLSESASFARSVIDAGATWVGPSPEAITEMGNKVAARQRARAAGVPVIPGTDGKVDTRIEAARLADEIGFPLAVKASAGGGGKGIRIVSRECELADAISMAQAEARSAFGDPSVYIERFVSRARHIEAQVLSDGMLTVHLGLRDCSTQRRRQKLIEEAGHLGLSADLSQNIAKAAVDLSQNVDYRGAGTVEFIVDESSGHFYFMEMNTRIQVEHPITEMVYGVDLVAEQLRIAAGERLSFGQDDLLPRGHAIEVRVNAEDPANGFFPCPGTITGVRLPGGPFVRVDSGVSNSSAIPPYYDSLIAKIVTWGSNREMAISRARRALSEFAVDGVTTTAAFARLIIESEEFRAGHCHTTWLEQWAGNGTSTNPEFNS